MAHDIQTITPAPIRKDLIWPFGGSNPPWVPRSRLLFTSDATVVDAVGVGDTAGVLMEFILPTNAVYVLNRLMLSLTGTDVDDWDSPAFRIYYSPNITDAPSITIQMDQPMANTVVEGAESSSTVSRFFSFGSGDRATASSTATMAQVMPTMPWTLPIFGGYGAGISPAFMMNNPTASSSAAVIAFTCEWHMYHVDAPLYAPFFANLPTAFQG